MRRTIKSACGFASAPPSAWCACTCLHFPALTETDPPAMWMTAACRLLGEAIDRLPEGDLHALPEWIESLPPDVNAPGQF